MTVSRFWTGIPLSRSWLVAVVLLALVVAACAPAAPTTTPTPAVTPPPADTPAPPDTPAPVEPTPAPTPTAEGCERLGQPEVTDIVFGHRLPGLNSLAPLLVADDQGFFEESGFTSFQLVITENVAAGILGRSLHFGAIETLDAGQNVVDDVPIHKISAYRNYSVSMIAVRSEFESVEDLEGQDVVLGGTPGSLDYDKRADLMAKNGWDLSGVNVNPVVIPGGSDAWVELFLEGQVAVTALFNRHVNRVRDAGHNIIVNEFEFGNDSVVANADFIEQNPVAVAQFLCAYIRGAQFWQDPANKEYILGLGAQQGIDITDAIRDAYELDILQFNRDEVYDGGFQRSDLQALFEEFLEQPPDLDEVLRVGPLHQAQEALGLPTRP